MLFAWKGATIFQAGPSKAMNWYSTNGTGSHVAAGLRADDSDAMCGNAVMYDATAGKILVVGGSIDYVYLLRCPECTRNLAYTSTARRQCDGKRPHPHHRYRNESSHRPDDQLDVVSKNLRERGCPSNGSGTHLRRPRLWNSVLRQWQPASAGIVGPCV